MSLYLVHAWRAGHNGEAGWCMTFQPWREGFTEGIERLKATVPAHERSFSPEGNVWWVSERYAVELTRLCPALDAHLRQKTLL